MDIYIIAISFIIPFFILLIIIEEYIAYRKNIKINRAADIISSLSSGITNVTRDGAKLGFILISYSWLVEHITIYKLEPLWLAITIAFIIEDFAGYWFHRMNHRINFFWNRHVIHHSSEEFNLACALRQSISDNIKFHAILFIPAALLGIPATLFAIISPIHLFMQFWYHTQLIDKMGFLEKILVTPSHHRVHHAINEEYLDKNLSQIFIIWDKLFGTFQEELEEVPPVYGVKRPLRSWNPILINFSHLFLLIKDAWRTKNILDKFRIWFMPTGWRPKDVNKKYPVDSIDTPNTYKKYYPKLSLKLQIWSWIQYLLVFFFMMYFINNLHRISFSDGVLYAIFLYISIYSLTSLMDQDSFAWLFEIIKALLGMYFIITYGDWFYITDYFDYATICITIYFIISSFIVIYFSVYEKKLSYISN